jgi:hypothetical protein
MEQSNWKKKIDKTIPLVSLALASGTAANLLYQARQGRALPWASTIIIWIIAAIILPLTRNAEHFIKKVLSTGIRIIAGPIIISPLLLLFGNTKNRQLLNDIHKTSMALQESAIFGRVAEIRNPKTTYYHIVYTHKDGHPPIGNLQNYKIAGFPVDESQMIMRLWYFVTNNLYLDWSCINPVCSCVYNRPRDKNRICKQSFSIIGSPKSNAFCKDLMIELPKLDNSRALKREYKYIMKLDENSNCYVEESGNTFRPNAINPTVPPQPYDVLEDYGLIMKLPNIFNKSAISDRHVILLFAGCKAGGQNGITAWFFSPENIARLAKYSAKYFQVFVKVRYHYVPEANPMIVDNVVMREEEIVYTP